MVNQLSEIAWIEIQSTDRKHLLAITDQLQIHPLALEDCFHQNQRAKFDDFENHQLLVWFAYLNQKKFEFEFVIFPNTLIMVTEEGPPVGNTWKEYLQINCNQRDSYHLLYQVLDKLTDASFANAKSLFNSIENFERKIFSESIDPRSLLTLRQDIADSEFTLAPLASVGGQVLRYLNPKDDLRWKWRDLVDHSERVQQSLVYYRQQISSTMETYWGFSSKRVNDRIKKLTLLASVSVPLTFWTSFWGMNFQALPFDKEWVFFIAIAIMLVSVAVIYFVLRKKGYWEKD